MNPDPRDPLLVSAISDVSARGRSVWGVICAIPLFMWGAAIVALGALGLIFVPVILLGAVSISGQTTPLRVVTWVVFHLSVCAHGCAMIIAAVSFCKLRWRRGVHAIAAGVIAPGILIAAVYLIVAFEAAHQ